jgi:tetratricopeptide (TPR) repeat protein
MANVAAAASILNGVSKSELQFCTFPIIGGGAYATKLPAQRSQERTRRLVIRLHTCLVGQRLGTARHRLRAARGKQMLSKASSFGADFRTLMQAAALQCDQQRCEAAISMLEEATRVQPGNASVFFHLGFCHTGGCREHSLVNSGMAIEYLRHALLLVGTSADPLLRAKILDALGNICGRKGASASGLHEAIACHQEAAEIYARLGRPNDWAREEFNQADAWCELAESKFPDKWTQAVSHYENALRIRTKKDDPRAYASTVMNLGTALRQLPSGDKKRNVLQAIRCYRQALLIDHFKTSPSQFAILCNNLGNACMTYPNQDGTSAERHARYAIRHFERALQVWTSEKYPYYYALVQYNLGGAYLELPAEPRHVAKTFACFTAAFECAKSSGYAEIERLAGAQLDGIRSFIRSGAAQASL